MDNKQTIDRHIWASFADYNDAAKAMAAFMDHGVPKDNIHLITERVPVEYQTETWTSTPNAMPGTAVVSTEAYGIGYRNTDKMEELERDYQAKMAKMERHYEEKLERERMDNADSTRIQKIEIDRRDEREKMQMEHKEEMEHERAREIKKEDKVESEPKSHASHGLTVTTGSDAAIGASKGVGWGLGIGVLAGIAALAVPGFGLIIGGGALATAIAGAVGTTVAGGIAGAVTGYLHDQGADSDTTTFVTERLNAGDAVLNVNIDVNRLSDLDANTLIEKYHGNRVVRPASV